MLREFSNAKLIKPFILDKEIILRTITLKVEARLTHPVGTQIIMIHEKLPRNKYSTLKVIMLNYHFKKGKKPISLTVSNSLRTPMN